jgi:hypothetical protein
MRIIMAEEGRGVLMEIRSAKQYVECLQKGGESANSTPKLQELKNQIDSFSEDKGICRLHAALA